MARAYRATLAEALADPDGVFAVDQVAVDDTTYPKGGQHSVGVYHQHGGAVGTASRCTQGRKRFGPLVTSVGGVIRGSLGVKRLPEACFGGLGQGYGGAPDAVLRQGPADLTKEPQLLRVAQAVIADREMQPKGGARGPNGAKLRALYGGCGVGSASSCVEV